jgi:hypothetical protein
MQTFIRRERLLRVMMMGQVSEELVVAWMDSKDRSVKMRQNIMFTLIKNFSY